MAIARRDCRQGTTSSSNLIACTAFSPNPSTGDSILVWMSSWRAAGVTHQAPTDTQSNTYTQIGTTQAGASGDSHISLWLATNITGGASFVVTGHVALAGSTITVIAVCLDQTVTYNGDTVGAVTGTPSANPASGTSTPAPAANSYFTAGVTKSAGAVATAGSGWQFFTNSTQTDNATFQDLYVEELTTTVSSSAQNGQFVCTSENWCARVASFAPVATATLNQEGYRFRNDDGSQTTATWKAAQDTPVSIPAGEPFRPRFLVDATGDVASKQFKAQYRIVGGPWRDIDTIG